MYRSPVRSVAFLEDSTRRLASWNLRIDRDLLDFSLFPRMHLQRCTRASDSYRFQKYIFGFFPPPLSAHVTNSRNSVWKFEILDSSYSDGNGCYTFEAHGTMYIFEHAYPYRVHNILKFH